MLKSILSNSRSTHTVPNRDQRANMANMDLANGHDAPIVDGFDNEAERNEESAAFNATNNFQVCIMCGETKPISNFSTVLRRRKSLVCRFCVKPKMSSSEGNGSPLMKSGICSGMSVDAAKKASRVRVASTSSLRHDARESSSAVLITTLGDIV
jgi:hypothetical protein